MGGAKLRRLAGTALLAAGTVTLAVLAAAALLNCHLARVALEVPMSPGDTGAAPAEPASQALPSEASPVDWDYWKAINPDVVGWVQVAGTSISFPVVQADGADPSHYLSHDVYGNWNYHGCPYVDAECEQGLDSPNVVICGHNLIDRTMFTELEGFHDRVFAEAHRDVTLYTPDGTRRLRVAGSETAAGWRRIKRTRFSGEEDFRAYVAERLRCCGVRFDDRPLPTRLVTLCTCSYFENPSDERTLVYAF